MIYEAVFLDFCNILLVVVQYSCIRCKFPDLENVFLAVLVPEGGVIYTVTRMWANAQRDGCPAKYRWRPLFNAAKFG